MKGNVKDAKGTPNPNYFIITDEQGAEYFAHLGDIKTNEDILYNNHQTEFLKKGDQVEFDVFEDNKPRAIRIKKLSNKCLTN